MWMILTIVSLCIHIIITASNPSPSYPSSPPYYSAQDPQNNFNGQYDQINDQQSYENRAMPPNTYSSNSQYAQQQSSGQNYPPQNSNKYQFTYGQSQGSMGYHAQSQELSKGSNQSPFYQGKLAPQNQLIPSSNNYDNLKRNTEGEGLFSKLKNTIFAAGNAIVGGIEDLQSSTFIGSSSSNHVDDNFYSNQAFNPNQQQSSSSYGVNPPSMQHPPLRDNTPPFGRNPVAPPPHVSNPTHLNRIDNSNDRQRSSLVPTSSPYPPSQKPPHFQPSPPQSEPAQNGPISGLFGKLKNIFQEPPSAEQDASLPSSHRTGNPSYGSTFQGVGSMPPRNIPEGTRFEPHSALRDGYGGGSYPPSSSGHPVQSNGPVGGGYSGSGPSYPPDPSFQNDRFKQSAGPDKNSYSSQYQRSGPPSNMNDHHSPTSSSSSSSSSPHNDFYNPPSEPNRPQSHPSQFADQPSFSSPYDQTRTPPQPIYQEFPSSYNEPPAAPVDPLDFISSDPQIFSLDDGSVVMILRPKEFYRKKLEMTGHGASGIQVFSDFEHAMTRFKTDDGGRCIGTAELLETSQALQLSAVQELRQVAMEFDASLSSNANPSTVAMEQHPNPPSSTKGSSTSNEMEVKLDDGRDERDGREAGHRLPQYSPDHSYAATTLNSLSGGQSSVVDEEASAFDEFTKKCHNIIARKGGLHIASVVPLVREQMPQIGLREGWKDALEVLGARGVPMYLFSSGYGDIVAQALIQGGLSSTSVSTAATAILLEEMSRATKLMEPSNPLNPPNYHTALQQQHFSPNAPMSNGIGSGSSPSVLPQNLRIISNFFRTGPDGTVRAFSQPTVHERNKNVTTAQSLMGMPLPDRPYGLVIGSHEDDVMMLDGLEGLKEKLSIGFLEMSDDLVYRLPTFLSTFDAVICGDGSFKFIGNLLEDVLDIPSNAKRFSIPSRQDKASESDALPTASNPGIRLGLSNIKNRLGSLFQVNNPSSSSEPPISGMMSHPNRMDSSDSGTALSGRYPLSSSQYDPTRNPVGKPSQTNPMTPRYRDPPTTQGKNFLDYSHDY